MKIDHPAEHYAPGALESGGKQRTRRGTRTIYRIVVRGELSARYAAAFEGMELRAANGRTIVTGEVTDQPHLHGILDRINGLGLELVRVEILPEEAHDSSLTLQNTLEEKR